MTVVVVVVVGLGGVGGKKDNEKRNRFGNRLSGE